MDQVTQSSQANNPQTHIKQQDWDDFIGDFNGINCRKMCSDPKQQGRVKKLFDNPQALKLFCDWCTTTPF